VGRAVEENPEKNLQLSEAEDHVVSPAVVREGVGVVIGVEFPQQPPDEVLERCVAFGF